MHSKLIKNLYYEIFHIIILISFVKKSNLISVKVSLSKPKTKLHKLSEQNIYGSAFKLNYYYTNMYLGSNMQKQGYILDTGSTITTSTCGPLCIHCGKHICPSYDTPDISQKIILCDEPKCKQTSSKCNPNNLNPKTNQCSFSISYSEGSVLKGVYIDEEIRFGSDYKNQKAYKMPIGCTKEENHLFYTQDANGIMGLANSEYNFVEILYKNGAIKNSIFSLCFSQLGGIFNIEEINNKTHIEKMTFIPMILDRGKYFGLNIESISVNNETLTQYQPFKYNIFIDSGTTICYIQEKIFDEIKNLMFKECDKISKKINNITNNNNNICGEYSYHSDFGHCFYFKTIEELNFAVNNYWPTIIFKLENYEYLWRPQYYVFNISTSQKPGACMGINKSYGNKLTLGSSWIIGHDIVFDRKNNKIGIAEANCSVNDESINITNGLELISDDYRLINESQNIINNNSDFKNKILNIYEKNNILIYIILAIISFFIMILILFILYNKYFKKNNSGNNKNKEAKKNKNYLKTSTNSIEVNDNKDINRDKESQSMIVNEA